MADEVKASENGEVSWCTTTNGIHDGKSDYDLMSSWQGMG